MFRSVLLLMTVIVMAFSGLNAMPNNSDLISYPILEDDTYLPFAEEMPQPVGGLEAIYKNISYPNIAKKLGIEGKVYVLIFVNETGSVDDVKVIKGIGGGCDEAAMNAIKKISFSPGKNGGVPAKVKMSLSIVFKMN